MHLMDGVVTAPYIVGGYAAAAGLCAWSAYKIRDEEIPRIAVFTAAFFCASLIHFPVGPTSVHLLFNGLVGVILGRRAIIAFLIGLFLQAALFSHGGFSVIGLNTCIFGIPALMVGYLYHWFLGKKESMRFMAGMVCGALGVLFSGLLLMLILIFCQKDSFRTLAHFIFVAHLPVMMIEGLVTGFTVQFLSKVQPVLLKGGQSP